MTQRIAVAGFWFLLVAVGAGCGGGTDGPDGVGEVGSESLDEAEAADPGADPGDDPGAEVPADAPPADVGEDGEAGACGDTQCSNCRDDDGDGLTDGFDPHCSSAADDDEATFATAIPGDNRDGTWQDCFFDGNSGSGGDGCRFHTCCLLDVCPPELASGFDRDTDCELTTECIENCLPAVTPGCDCFGCCTIYVEGVGYTVYTNPAVAPDCTLDGIADPDLCPPCTPTDECESPCINVECELCPGQTEDDLPESCTGAACDPGVTVCATSADCPEGYYCSVGCCIEDIILI